MCIVTGPRRGGPWIRLRSVRSAAAWGIHHDRGSYERRSLLLFIIKRIVWIVPVLLVATLISFALVKQLPQPFVNNQHISDAVKDNLTALYGLDDPWPVQYSRYIVNLATGDLGLSTKPGAPKVGEIIADTLPTSVLLGVLAFSFSLVVGTTAGVLSAIWANRWPDYLLTLLSTIFFALPSFLVAKYFVEYVPDYTIGWETWAARIGPTVILGLAIMPYFTRIVRASTLESLQSEYVVTARSKGLRWQTTVVRHVVRNSMIPMVTNAGPLFGFVVTGSFIIERICDIPGVASQFIRAFQEPLDSNMVLGTTVLVSVTVIIANLVADLLVAWIDPRITNE
jgi:oligopeptide transport system permease protein